jgi:hypothetical protein
MGFGRKEDEGREVYDQRCLGEGLRRGGGRPGLACLVEGRTTRRLSLTSLFPYALTFAQVKRELVGTVKECGLLGPSFVVCPRGHKIRRADDRYG